MNRSVKCEAGRAGTCPWITRFPAPEAELVSTPLQADETHEDRALRLHDEAGAPSAAAPKIFFRYYFVNSSTGEKSGTMLAECKWTAAAAAGGEP